MQTERGERQRMREPHSIVGLPCCFSLEYCDVCSSKGLLSLSLLHFKVRLPWICILQRLTGRAICRPKKTMLTNKLVCPHPHPISPRHRKTTSEDARGCCFKDGTQLNPASVCNKPNNKTSPQVREENHLVKKKKKNYNDSLYTHTRCEREKLVNTVSRHRSENKYSAVLI